ncbi:MAG: thiamine pyrophosphate-binding protein [Candidatus Methanofastidiosia archaeon]
MNGSMVLVHSLCDHGVEYIFGLPGDTSLDWYEALHDSASSVTHVLATDERNAVYMADAYARISNKPGICEGPSGAGATYMVPGVYEANNSSIPLIAINTDIFTTERGKARLTEVDQVSLFEKATKWSIQIDNVNRIPEYVRKAFREATAGKPGAVHLTFPADILAQEVDAVPHKLPAYWLTFTRVPAVRYSPSADNIAHAVDLILDSEAPVIVAGGGIHTSGAYDALEKFAITIAAPVGTSITGKGSIDERHPLSIGVVGENGGSDYANAVVKEADLVIFVGTQTGSVVTHHWSIPSDDAVIIQIDIDPREIGRNYIVDCGLLGDARAVLEELITGLQYRVKKIDRTQSIHEKLKNFHQQKQEIEEYNNVIHPLRIVKICERLFPPETILVSDAGTPTPYFALHYATRTGRTCVIPRAFGALGYAIPAAVGVHKADKTSRVVSLTGDGSLLVSMAELNTLARENVPCVVILFHNTEYSWIKVHMKYRKDQKYISLDLPDISYSTIAESMGLTSYTVRTREEFEEALATALNNHTPSFIDAHTVPLHHLDRNFLPWNVRGL